MSFFFTPSALHFWALHNFRYAEEDENVLNAGPQVFTEFIEVSEAGFPEDISLDQMELPSSPASEQPKSAEQYS